MSTDEQYKPIEFREKYVCGDQYLKMLAAGLLEQIKYSKSLEERNGIFYSHIELLNKALDVLCPLVARTIDFLPSEQFTLRAATREALDNVTYIQNKEYRENTNQDYYKQGEENYD